MKKVDSGCERYTRRCNGGWEDFLRVTFPENFLILSIQQPSSRPHWILHLVSATASFASSKMSNFTEPVDLSRRAQTINLGAGPSTLPNEVLLSASSGILDFASTGMGLTELSHRSSTFKKVIQKAESDLRQLLDIPQDYSVLFQQGGGTEQFSATALNLLSYHASKNPDYVRQNKLQRRSNGENKGQDEVVDEEEESFGPPCDYVVSGSWSVKAMKEAKRLGANSRAVIDSRKSKGSLGKFDSIPPTSEWDLSPVSSKPAFLYYCDNETVDGVEFPSPGFPFEELPPEYREQVPIVADMSSNILSRPIDIKSHSIIFFGAQKNVGPSGVTILIVKKSILVDPDLQIKNGGPRIPSTLIYKTASDNESLYNTPSMFAIYVSGLTFDHLLNKEGGVKGAEQRAIEKSDMVYNCIAESEGVFRPTVKSQKDRSKMNICFRICKKGTDAPDDELETRFVENCSKNGIVQVKGHRSVGGIRTSLYNAVSVENTKTLVKVMKEFLEEAK